MNNRVMIEILFFSIHTNLILDLPPEIPLEQLIKVGTRVTRGKDWKSDYKNQVGNNWIPGYLEVTYLGTLK